MVALILVWFGFRVLGEFTMFGDGGLRLVRSRATKIIPRFLNIASCSTINIYEVYKRILQQRAENDALQAVAVMQHTQVIDITSALALFAARISCEIKLPMADSIILATAKSRDATLWTQDSDFKEIHSVKYIKK